jgi:uncharacterized coiled-coil DUF342 family protein
MSSNRPPPEPEYSCPLLDGAIAEIEAARKIHDKLRTWGSWWESRATELEEEMSDKVDELKEKTEDQDKKIDELNDQIEDLNRQIEGWKAEFRDLQTRAT